MTQKERTVHFCNTHQINTSVTEESENEENEPSSSNDQYLTNVSSSAIKSGGDMHSASSISTSILDDAEEVKELKAKLVEFEAKCKTLEISNEKLNIDLNNERSKNSKLEKKLQFVKDNQEVFMRLKEAYINMKYNEAAGRKMVEVREKSVQTWEGIICRACIETEELRRKMDSINETFKNAIIVSSAEMEQLTNTVNYLGGLVTRREKSWLTSVERANQLQSNVLILQNENAALKSLLQTQENYSDDKHVVASTSNENNAEVVQLKKIIIKYEKRLKLIENHHEGLHPFLSDREKRLVQQLMTKYNTRISRSKTRSLSAERKCALNKSPRRGRSKSLEKRIQPELPRGKNENADNTIKIMDYLLDN